MSHQATSSPNRSVTWKALSPVCRSRKHRERTCRLGRRSDGRGGTPAPEPVGPDAAAFKAQDRVLTAGGKLSDPEKFKREQHPFDTYERLKEHAAKNEYPKPPDNFRWRFFGLFYVAPNQNSYHVPAAHAERHSQSAPVCRRRRSRRALRRRLRARHDPRQSADARDRGQERRRHDRGGAGLGPVLARLRRRQYPQRHRHARPPASTAKN